MNFIRSLAATSLGFLTLSMGEVNHSALLTDNYGIITQYELRTSLQYTHQECRNYGVNCPAYWACLQIDAFSLECELTDDEDLTFAPSLKMQAGESSIEFFTRRPNTIEDCKKILNQWFDLLVGQQAACFLASYDPERGEVPYNRASFYLQLDGIKSLRGRWSYFEN